MLKGAIITAQWRSGFITHAPKYSNKTHHKSLTTWFIKWKQHKGRIKQETSEWAIILEEAQVKLEGLYTNEEKENSNFTTKITILRLQQTEKCARWKAFEHPLYRETHWLFLLWERHGYFLKQNALTVCTSCCNVLKNVTCPSATVCFVQFSESREMPFNSIHACLFCAEREQHCCFDKLHYSSWFNSSTAKNNVSKSESLLQSTPSLPQLGIKIEVLQ